MIVKLSIVVKMRVSLHSGRLLSGGIVCPIGIQSISESEPDGTGMENLRINPSMNIPTSIDTRSALCQSTVLRGTLVDVAASGSTLWEIL